MATNLVAYSDQPIGQNVLTATRDKALEPEVSQSFAVYPNPASGRFTVEQTTPFRTLRLRLFAPTGQLVYDSGARDGWPGLLFPIDISGKPSGLYHLAITTEAGTAVKRVLVY